MRVSELKALSREHGLRGYSRLRKAELIALLRDSQLRRPPQSVRFKPDRPRQPSLSGPSPQRNGYIQTTGDE